MEVRAFRVDSGDRLLRRGSIFEYRESRILSGEVERELSRECEGERRIDGGMGLMPDAISNDRLQP